MDTFMSFMDKIYSDTKALTIVYIVGAALLLVFVIMLIFSIRKPSKKKLNTKILDEPNIKENKKEENTEVKEDVVTTSSVEESKEEQTEEKSDVTAIPVIETTPKEDEVVVTDESPVSKALDNVENKDIMNVVKDDEPNVANISSEIPDVDDFVDSVVKKAYEKNEQFSSVFVGDNTTTIKLDKVLENLNVDEDIKVDIVPDEEKTVVETKPVAESSEITSEPTEEVAIEMPVAAEVKEETNTVNDLDSLKKAMEEKKKEVNTKQDELKAKLANLKQPEKKDDVLKAEDLLNKLNSMKNE